MTLDDARRLFAYNDWANVRMLQSLDAVTPEQWTQPLGSSFPTIAATAAHIAAAEWVWLSRWKGASPTAMPEWAERPALSALKSQFAALEADRTAYLAGVVDADLPQPFPFTLFNGKPDVQPLGVQFQHLVNHGTYHRGQIATLLRQVGAKPIATDLIRWAREI